MFAGLYLYLYLTSVDVNEQDADIVNKGWIFSIPAGAHNTKNPNYDPILTFYHFYLNS